MQGAGGRTVRGRLHKQLDLELKQAKQAEARLSQHLQRLEQTYRYQLRMLSWEQRQLQGHLQRLQLAEIIQKRGSSYLGNGIQKRPGAAPQRPPQGGEPGVPRAPAGRALATTTPQEVHRAGSQGPPPCHTGLEDPADSKEPSMSQGCAPSRVPEEPPADQAAPTDAPDPGPGPAGGRGEAQGDEAGSEDGNLQPDLRNEEHVSPRAPACAGHLSGQASAASYLELSAKAANAHYLRHRVPPEFERLLSIAEIFGHRDPATQSGPASAPPPL
ncbi:coiled-coil domain-containing protein 190 [Molossus molossus]|uniref:Coiled-coil domain containing 190 n=1 Tax=Molossus molossus TaxID=27622 RepID=A0A7J8CPS1_MOLMO|nr:coiled-coil domain-containing protein 190 [Molossus molossus]KAF6412868.1 coiled-coil domain containing 190 [Molossus molossus]